MCVRAFVYAPVGVYCLRALVLARMCEWNVAVPINQINSSSNNKSKRTLKNYVLFLQN